MGQWNSTTSRDEAEDTPLMKAVRTNNGKAARKLIKNGARPLDISDALWFAIKTEQIEMGTKLVPACVSQCERQDCIRLVCFAAYRGSAAIVRKFAGEDASLVVSPEASSGKKAIDFALDAKRKAVVKFLQSLGAEPSNGKEPAQLAHSTDAYATTNISTTVVPSLRAAFGVSGPKNRASEPDTDRTASSSSGSIEEYLLASKLVSSHGDNVVFSHILPTGYVGNGAFGMVSAGWYNNKQVAFKVEQRRHGGSTVMNAPRMNKFAYEARLLAVLQEPSHKFCVGFLGVGVDPDVGVAIVTEFVGGGSLRSKLSADGLDAVQGLALCTGLAAGLTFLHESGIVHGDIKPDNILLSGVEADLGVVSGKIIDLGGAYAYWRGRTAHTLRYAAPEVTVTGLTEAKSDVFSFGCVMYEVLSGRALTDRADPSDSWPVAYDSGIDVTAVIESQLPDELTGEGLGQLMSACWTHRARDRPRSIELYETLLCILRAFDAESAVEVEREHITSPPSGNSPLMAAVQYCDSAEIVRLVHSGHAVDCANRWGQTPLHVAAAVCNPDAAQLLIAKGALLRKDAFGVEPRDILHDQEEFGVNVSAMENLLSSLSDDGDQLFEDESPPTSKRAALASAIADRDVGRVRFLVEEGLSVLSEDTDTESELSVLELACQVGATDVLEYLVSAWVATGGSGVEQWIRLFQIVIDEPPSQTFEHLATLMVHHDLLYWEAVLWSAVDYVVETGSEDWVPRIAGAGRVGSWSPLSSVSKIDNIK